MKASAIIIAMAFPALLPIPDAFAQTPAVQMFFDEQFQVPAMECTGAVLDTLYVVANGFDAQIVDIEYLIYLNVYLLWIADLIEPTYTATGTSVAGIVVSFPAPVDATGPFLIQRILFEWLCDGCPHDGIPYIQVRPHPISGKVQATRWPDLVKIEAAGMTNVLCGVIPVEETTWGQVKALYR